MSPDNVTCQMCASTHKNNAVIFPATTTWADLQCASTADSEEINKHLQKPNKGCKSYHSHLHYTVDTRIVQLAAK